MEDEYEEEYEEEEEEVESVQIVKPAKGKEI